MADAKCRYCNHAAAAGAYSSWCAADIMAKALNPFFGGPRKNPPGRGHPDPPLPSLNTGSSSNTCVQLYAGSFQQIPGRQAGVA